jgi:hypothetical protein
MVVYPKGKDYQWGPLLGIQFGCDVLAMTIAAFLLSKAIPVKGYLTRVMFVGLMGLLPTLQVDLPQWNWYGFPTVFVVAQLVVHLVGFWRPDWWWRSWSPANPRAGRRPLQRRDYPIHCGLRAVPSCLVVVLKVSNLPESAACAFLPAAPKARSV